MGNALLRPKESRNPDFAETPLAERNPRSTPQKSASQGKRGKGHVSQDSRQQMPAPGLTKIPKF
jgi:hypothetical protein